MHYAPKTISGILTPMSFKSVESYSAFESATVFSMPTSTISVGRLPWAELSTSKYLRSRSGPGVYAIVSGSQDDDVECDVYVGSSGAVGGRLLSHKQDNRHRNGQTIFVCTSTSLELTSTHFKRAEGILNRASALQPKVQVTSADVPPFKMSSRCEAIMTSLVPQMVELLAAGGYPLNRHPEFVLEDVDFLPTCRAPDPSDPKIYGGALSALSTELWSFSDKDGCLSDYSLSGTMTENRTFVLFPGSEFRVDGDLKLTPTTVRAREQLLASGVLEPTGAADGRLRLTYPVEMASPKTAVYVMLQSNRPSSRYWTHGKPGAEPIGNQTAATGAAR